MSNNKPQYHIIRKRLEINLSYLQSKLSQYLPEPYQRALSEGAGEPDETVSIPYDVLDTMSVAVTNSLTVLNTLATITAFGDNDGKEQETT